ncbi:NADH:ubiquinone oxidoreductase [Candidatus Bipolaricaulota bacterium]|nr:NADH:ubiquinone oxidoreductase [Candidatus Bipolaricaulota bacterium]MCK5586152.1 NADH:ubiquinone oxidoreductase [Candidatus Bipolaricaulota bacterium]
MKPQVAFFDFTCCEGCQLDTLNIEGQDLVDLLDAVDIVEFREVATGKAEHYDIAFVEGSITRESEIDRLKDIRNRADVVIALGACAHIGGVNCLKNHLPMEEALTIVYGDDAKYYDTLPARPIHEVIPVDFSVPGCPINTVELLRIVKELLLGKTPEIPNHPVCVECKMAGNICVFERGKTCLGPVIRAGCNAICVTAGRYCWGCRGLVDDPNLDAQKEVLAKYGLTVESVVEKFKIYNTYSEVAK